MNKKELLKKLSEIEFAALDLQLYLNTHPDDKNALKDYNKCVNDAMDVREEYEAYFGPLYSYVSMSEDDRFSWIEEPWPWEKEFNNK